MLLLLAREDYNLPDKWIFSLLLATCCSMAGQNYFRLPR